MQKNKIKFSVIFLIMAFFAACTTESQQNNPNQSASSEQTPEPVVGVVEDVLTKAEQDALSPDMVIQSLKEGNARFMH